MAVAKKKAAKKKATKARAAPRKKSTRIERAVADSLPDQSPVALTPTVTGDDAIAWIEAYCRIPEGKFVGQPVKLTRQQKDWLHLIYDTPTRTFILSMGRKGAKTALASFLLLYHLAGTASKPNSQLYSAAQSRDQAAIIFNYAAKCVRMSPELSQFVGIRDTAKQLFCPERGTLYRALSAEASTSFGLSPAFVIHDELGQVRGPRSELYEALETGGAAQEQPLSVIISTQAPSADDLLSMLIDDALSGADPRVKVVLYTAPMDIDPFSEEAIRAANPHFDELMNKEEVRRQAEDARRLPAREPAYRNLVLNQRIEATAPPLVSRGIWLANGKAPEPLAKQKVWGGLDLSSVSDLTAFVLLSEGNDVVPSFWLPGEGLAEKSRLDRVAYDKWAEQGYLLTTPGKAIEYSFIAEHLRGVFDTFDVQGIAFDRYNMRFLKPWLMLAGFTDAELEKFVEFGQGFVSMSPAIRETETLLLGERLKHGNHPVLTMCAANATTVSDPAGNRKYTKMRGTGRIDGMVALTMAVGIRTAGVAPGKTAEKKYQLFFI